MEDLLHLYAEDHVEDYPVVTFDESPYQLISETRVPLPIEPGQRQRFESIFERNGVSNLFVFFAPFENWRHVKVTDHRTSVEWGACMKAVIIRRR